MVGVAVLVERGLDGRASPRPNDRVPAANRRTKAPRARSVSGVLHGRDDERARLAALVDGARGGRAGALLLHGEPGVGKSALLEDPVGAEASTTAITAVVHAVATGAPVATS